MSNEYLENSIKQFELYKSLAEKTFDQVPDDKLFWQYNEDCNTIGVIVKHLWGNMLSRWTNFLTTDGEKDWRERDAEFENDIQTRKELMDKWNEAWNCLFNTLNSLTAADLDKTVYIRNQGHKVTDAINRNLAHCAYHIGQIVYIGKMVHKDEWHSLSIPKGQSKQFK
jgi:hypothetical protein